MKKNLIYSLLFIFYIISSLPANAQIIEADPLYPHVSGPVDIIFHVNRCNCSLQGFTGDIYAHTGLITDESVDNGDWKNVIAEWGVNLPKALLQKQDDSTYILSVSPSVNEYYETGDTLNVEQLAFVFRNPGGTLQTSNLYYDLYETGLTIDIIRPQGNVILKPDDTINIAATTIAIGTEAPDSIILYHDDTLTYVSYADTLIYEIIAEQIGIHWILLEATNEDFNTKDSLYYFVSEEVIVAELPAGVIDGINYIDTSTVTLVLHAPFKEEVFLIGDFNNWELSNDYLMYRTPDNERYWITLDSVNKGEEYAFQYLVDGNLRIADPYTEKILDPVNDVNIPVSTYPDLKPYPVGKTTGNVSVFQTNRQEFEWTDAEFEPVPVTNLVIYELHIRDFVGERNFRTVMDTLDYLEYMGINAIEFMPVSEFEGNDSWGYNPSFYFAVDKYYGTSDDFKALINECHRRGIAVFMDIVLNHSYRQSPLVQLYYDEEADRPTAESPWYNEDCPHDPWCWGYDFNHESEATRTFVNRVNRFWIEEYHIDGFRFDFTKGFTNTIGDGWVYDASRVEILTNMYDEIIAVDPESVVIFEHLSENTEETELANHGILLWGKMTDPYNEATMGYHTAGKSDLSGISYKSRGWDEAHLVGYMESHDEQRLMFKNQEYGNMLGDYDVKDLNTGLRRVEAAATMFFTVPGPKMVWQFGELGYDVSIDEPCRVCVKPLHWEYYDEPARKRLYLLFASLINLRTSEELFETEDFTLNVANAVKRINLYSSSANGVIAANFDLQKGSIAGNFQHTGNWYEYFTGDTIEVTSTDQPIELWPGEYRLYTDVKFSDPLVPPLAVSDNSGKPSSLRLFPNPTEGIITLIPQQTDLTELIISSMDGKEMYRHQWNAIAGSPNSFNIKEHIAIRKGIYLYVIRNNRDSWHGKLIVE